MFTRYFVNSIFFSHSIAVSFVQKWSLWRVSTHFGVCFLHVQAMDMAVLFAS